MTKLSQTPPLKVVHVNKMKQVAIHTNEPLLPKKVSKKVRQEIYILQQLGQLEILLEKKNRLELWKAKGGLTTAEHLLKDLEDKISSIQKSLEPSMVLKVKENTKSLYPKARQHLFKDGPYLSTNNVREEYQLDHLYQLYVTACRLYYDLRLTDHKYIVYQLALLYQCINRQGVHFIGYKSRIEQKFSEIVVHSKKSDKVKLDTHRITWLQSLCLDIIMQVTDYNSVTKCSELFNYIHQVNHV